MKSITLKMKYAFALALGAILAAGPVMAEKPSWAGAGKGGKDERMDRRNEQKGERRDDGAKSRRDKDGPAAGKRSHFEDQHRAYVREYYAEQFRGGRGPPGLGKKNKRGLAPGPAEKLPRGRPFAGGGIFYEVPRPLVVQLGAPPRGHRYVRVATDILLIAIGTGMVVDAIQDLGR